MQCQRDAVGVMAAQRREPRIETRWRAHDLTNPHILGKESRETANQRGEFRIAGMVTAAVGMSEMIGRDVDVGDLAGRMHT